MTGREIFQKYNCIISVLVGATRRLPRKIRIWLYNSNRNRDGKMGMLIRYLVVSSLAKEVGINVAIYPGVFIQNIENLSIGDNVSIHQMCYIDAVGGIEIGNDVSIAHRSTILSSNHGYQKLDIPIKYQEMELAKTTIKDNVWIGCGCSILAGTEIGGGTVIGANSTVTKSIPENCIAVGSPAKVIKTRRANIIN